MRRGWWIGAAAFGATLVYLLGHARDTRRRRHVGDRLGAAAAFYGVVRISRGAAPASRSASGPAAARARSRYMTPRALALVSNEPRRTPA